MIRVVARLRCLSPDTLLKCTAASSNVVATCFIGLMEFYYSPHVLILQDSPYYPPALKWLARSLLFSASLISVVIAWRGAREDIRNSMTLTVSESAAPIKRDEGITENRGESVPSKVAEATSTAHSDS